MIEAEGGRVKINPLAPLSACDLEAEFAARGLPRHPLVADGFLSIGCMPCTSRPVRAGRSALGALGGERKDRMRHPSVLEFVLPLIHVRFA